MENKKRKYTFRYTWKSFVDITVEAESREDAAEMAEERYNREEYDQDGIMDESTGVELIKVE